jgi:hypothetical protein
MNKFFFLIFSGFAFWSCSISYKKIAPKIETSENFPASWQGNWEGTLEIFSTKGLSQSIPMAVEISKIDTSENRYVWALIYGKDKVKGRRAYELVIKDASKGVYVNDEKNTIAMESYLIDKKLYCYFSVMGNFLTSTMEKINENTMLFEITSGSDQPVSVTGNQIFQGDTIPAVKTFPVRIVQKAILKKNNFK